MQLVLGGALTGLVVLGVLRKQAEQALKSRPVHSSPPGTLSQCQPPGCCTGFLPCISWRVDYKL